MSSSTNPPPQASTNSTMSGNNSNNQHSPSKYHALIIDSGAIIKQTSLSSFNTNSLLTSAQHFVTVPAVLAEIRDPKSRKHLEEFQLRLESLHDTKLETRTPSQAAMAAMSEFARKTGDYSQLSGVDLQVLALLWDLEVEAANLYNDGRLDHVRKEPKRVLGVNVKALNGDGKRDVVRRERGGSVASGSVASSSAATGSIMSTTAFFHGDADGIIDAAHVDYDDDDEDDRVITDPAYGTEEDSVSATTNSSSVPSGPKSWAVLVNPQKAPTAAPVDYSIATSSYVDLTSENQTLEEPTLDMDLKEDAPAVVGQFDDASDDDFSNCSDSDGELDAINIANATSDGEMSDEECDVFILEPHEAVYFKKLKEEKKQKELVQQMEQQTMNEAEPESEFPSLAATVAVPYEGSDDETEELTQDNKAAQLTFQQDEEERKKKALQPMVNGRAAHKNNQAPSNAFRKYKNVVSADGSAVAMKQQKEHSKEEEDKTALEATASSGNDDGDVKKDSTNTGNANSLEYKSRILGAGASANTDPSEMTAADDDGEGWVTCTSDIRTMKATGSLHLSSRNHSNSKKSAAQRKNAGPPISQRAACATTDFAMQNVILQMNLELLSVDGVRVRRLKTWVTRCGACFTIYGNDEKRKSERLFCDKCGSNTLQRIAASVDRNTGRLKLHMRKNYQYNTRGSKFSLPKAGKGNKYEGDLLLAEDQLMYGAWNQKVRKGKSKTAGQSIFGSDLASDLGCHADLTKRDDIKVGFGRRNPNATKFGRERRGKKKKGVADKACGLRRY